MDLNIRVKHPDSLPFVGHFTDPCDVSGAVAPVTMQLEVEDIKDDAEEANVTKDAEFYRQKAKKRRIFYSKKHIMKLQDATPREEDGPPRGLIFEGKPWAPSSTSLTGEVQKVESRAVHIKKSDIEEASGINQYALLQVVKRENPQTKKMETEVNMIPLDGFYNFRKPAPKTQLTLELVDDDFEEELARRKKSHAKYQAFITKPVTDEDEEEPGIGGSSSSSSKKPAGSRMSLDSSSSDRRGGDGKYELPSVFGLALQNRKFAKGANKKEYLDEAGVALDEEQAADTEFGGDYDKSYANNDMAYADEGATFAQAQAELAEESERAKKQDYLEEVDEGPEEVDSDFEDDDDEVEDVSNKAIAKTSGVVDDQVLYDARQASKGLETQMTKDDPSMTAAAVGSRKRGRSSPNSDTNGEADTAKRSRPSSTDELTESDVRAFLLENGGKAPLETLKMQFKRQVKAMNKKASGSGVAAITAIIKKLCRVSHDVLEGKIVALK